MSQSSGSERVNGSPAVGSPAVEGPYPLARVERHASPFLHLRCRQALGPVVCADLDACFEHADGWRAHDGDFYRCAIRVVTDEVPGALLLRCTTNGMDSVPSLQTRWHGAGA